MATKNVKNAFLKKSFIVVNRICSVWSLLQIIVEFYLVTKDYSRTWTFIFKWNCLDAGIVQQKLKKRSRSSNLIPVVVPLLAGVEQRFEKGLGLLPFDDCDAATGRWQRVPRRLHRARHQVPHRVHQGTSAHRIRICTIEYCHNIVSVIS